MPDHSTRFEAAGSGLALTDAILLYRSGTLRPGDVYDRHGAAFASLHAVERDDDGNPTIAAGVPLSRAHLRHWTETLGRTTVPEILPTGVLVFHPDMLAWWVPAQVRPAHFALSAPPAELRALSGRTTVTVPYPAHLFVAKRSGLRIYALPASERPTAATRLLHSPVLNVFVDGSLCWGDIPRPKTLSVASIPAFERAVFDSWSTHPNPGQELTVTGKGGLVRLWDDLAIRRAQCFPVRRLKPFMAGPRRQAPPSPGDTASDVMTLGQLIAPGIRS